MKNPREQGSLGQLKPMIEMKSGLFFSPIVIIFNLGVIIHTKH